MKTQHVYLSVAVACLMAISIAGCGDDSKKVQDAGLDGGGGGESITFIVVEWSTDSEDWVSMEGATVAFDAPGGERTETVSGADGKVTFEGVDWSLGTAAATAHQPDYVLSSLVNIDPSDLGIALIIEGSITLQMLPLESKTTETLGVSGTVVGLQDADHEWKASVVGMKSESSCDKTSDGTFSLEVPSGEPFIIQVTEYIVGPVPPSGQGYDQPIYQWMQRSFEATTEELTDVELDFAVSAMETHTADITFEVPARSESPIRDGYGVCNMCDSGSYWCQGWSTHLDISEDGSLFESSLVWVEPEYADDPRVSCGVYVLVGNQWVWGSYISIEGYPDDGDSFGTLMDKPEWLTPEEGGDAYPIQDPLEWEVFDDNVTNIGLFLSKGEQLVWGVGSTPSQTSMTVPEPPSTVDKNELLGSSYLSAQLYAGILDSDNHYWERMGISTTINVMVSEQVGDYWEDGACFGDSPNPPSSPDCNGVTFEGCCDEEAKVIWCEDEVLYCVDCPSEHEIDCGWSSTESYYGCSDEPGGEDPSAEHPIECP